MYFGAVRSATRLPSSGMHPRSRIHSRRFHHSSVRLLTKRSLSMAPAPNMTGMQRRPCSPRRSITPLPYPPLLSTAILPAKPCVLAAFSIFPAVTISSCLLATSRIVASSPASMMSAVLSLPNRAMSAPSPFTRCRNGFGARATASSAHFNGISVSSDSTGKSPRTRLQKIGESSPQSRLASSTNSGPTSFSRSSSGTGSPVKLGLSRHEIAMVCHDPSR